MGVVRDVRGPATTLPAGISAPNAASRAAAAAASSSVSGALSSLGRTAHMNSASVVKGRDTGAAAGQPPDDAASLISSRTKISQSHNILNPRFLS